MKNFFKKILPLSLALSLAMGSSPLLNIEISKTVFASSVVEISSDNLGNIFYGKEQKFYINIENNALPVSYTVLGEDGSTVSSGQVTDEDINDNGLCELDLKIDKYGVYTLDVDGTKALFSVCKAVNHTNITLGVATHQNNHKLTGDPDPVTEFITSTTAYGGFGTARDTVLWSQTEKTEGTYAVAEQTMEYIDSLVAKGIEPVMMLGYGNSIYGANFGGTSGNHQFGVFETDAQIEAYAKYCGEVARLLKGKVKYFEICNEPNLANNIKDEGGNVLYGKQGEQYAKTIDAAYKAIITENPQAEIIGYSLANSLASDETQEWLNSSVDYTKDVLDNQAYHYLDIHPYCWGNSPEKSTVPDDVAEFQDYFAERGLPNDSLWLTEVGYTSSNHENGVNDEHTQAVYMARYYTILKAKYGMDIRMNIYDLIDDGTDLTDREHGFGMLQEKDHAVTPYSAKPTYLAMANINDLVGRAYSITEVLKDESTIPVVGTFLSGAYTYKYETPDTDVYMMWATDDSKKAEIDEISNAKFYDVYGNEISCAYSGGYTVGNDPIYAVVQNKKMYIGDMTESRVTITGTVPSGNAGETVSLLVADADEKDMFSSIKYINETKTTAGGGFTFESPIQDGAGYKAYLNTMGKLSSPICIEFYNTGNEKAVLNLKNTASIKSLTEISNADKLSIDIGFNKMTKATNYQLMYAMYSGKALADVVTFGDTITPADGIVTRTYSVSKQDMTGIDTVKVFLWEDMTPICTYKIYE